MADSINIEQHFLPAGHAMKSRGGKSVEYLVIHYTASGNSKPGTAASLDNIDSWKRGDASADFSVDDGTIVQYNPDVKAWGCYAVGGSYNCEKTKGGKFKGIANCFNCVSIEVCSTLKKGAKAIENSGNFYFTQETLANALKLSRHLMQEYNIPIDRVIRHYDTSGKICPGIIGWNCAPLYDPQTHAETSEMNNENEWLAFKQAIQNGGAVVPGYKKATCWGKKDLAEALKKVNEDLKKQGMELVIFDAYRPKAALDAFIAWKGKNRCTASDIMYQPFGCTVKPDFKGLISDKSTHNYGLSVDLTIKNNSSATHPKGLWEGSTIMNTKLDEFMIKRDSKSKQSSSGYWYECSIPIDGKTNYDFKNPQHRFLRSIMEKYKFQGISSEWWHFQLNGAKYCNTNTEMIQ